MGFSVMLRFLVLQVDEVKVWFDERLRSTRVKVWF